MLLSQTSNDKIDGKPREGVVDAPLYVDNFEILGEGGQPVLIHSDGAVQPFDEVVSDRLAVIKLNDDGVDHECAYNFLGS